MMAIEFIRKVGDGWRLEAQKAGVVIGEITENEGLYFFYQGADIKLGSPVLPKTPLAARAGDVVPCQAFLLYNRFGHT